MTPGCWQARRGAWRGVTLIEMAIALGVAGVLLGGVWVAASAAREAYRMSETMDQVRHIVEGVRDRYLTTQQIPRQDYDIFTQSLAAADIFPAAMRINHAVDPAACSAASPCYFDHAWGGDPAGSACGGGTVCATSAAAQVTLVMGAATVSGFVLVLRRLPQAACIGIASRFIGVWNDIGMGGIGFREGDGDSPGIVQAGGPPAPAFIQANCAAENNTLYLGFRQSP